MWEWVGDWGDQADTTPTHWPDTFGGDLSWVGGPGSGFPAALLRGGNFFDAASAGVFAIQGGVFAVPSFSFSGNGFRCAR